MNIRPASVADLEVLTSLFDAYRIFYRQPSDPAAARAFLADRFQHQQSIILIAFDREQAVGFTQIYPVFSSVRLERTFLLNDLFVAPEARRSGVGKALLEAACDYGRQVGAKRLTLSTAVDNVKAQSLYEEAGWVRDLEFYAYGITL